MASSSTSTPKAPTSPRAANPSTNRPATPQTYSLSRLARNMHAKQLENERSRPSFKAQHRRDSTLAQPSPNKPPATSTAPPWKTSSHATLLKSLSILILLSTFYIFPPLLSKALKYLFFALLGHIFFSVLHWRIYAGETTTSNLWAPTVGEVKEAQVLKVCGCELVVRRAVGGTSGGVEERVWAMFGKVFGTASREEDSGK